MQQLYRDGLVRCGVVILELGFGHFDAGVCVIGRVGAWGSLGVCSQFGILQAVRVSYYAEYLIVLQGADRIHCHGLRRSSEIHCYGLPTSFYYSS